MRLLLNVLWAIFGGGFITALQYLLVGLLLCATVVGIPFGLQCFKIAGLAFFPFGKDYDDANRQGVARIAFNMLWLVFAGIWICLTHLSLALASAVTIIGIPFALQHIKLAVLALAPFGVEVHTRAG
jgi:uncharacterized membrane protein YccF (DUF307 family)